ncbi:MAG: acyl-CoA thioesterase [Ignavibacterium sp.]|nr:acyl-CoA thioesterase [Ignavibacterium sp.]
MKTFTIKRRINFYDCDPAGIIFYSRVFEFAHSAYEQIIQLVEKEEDYWNNDKYVVPIIKSESTYIKPMKYGDEITINVKVSELRTSSFELSYNMVNADGELLCSVKTVHVFVAKKNWEKMEMPGTIKLSLERMI